MQQRGSGPDWPRRGKARAKAVGAPPRRKQSDIARAVDIVSLAVAIWLGVLVAAEGVQKLGEMTPNSGISTGAPALQRSLPAGFGS